MSPRRSSRARTSQPQQNAPQQQTTSSNSSITSGRADRTARSHHKTLSPQSSAAPQSRSSEEVEDSAKPPIRRTRSSQEDIKDTIQAAPEDEEDEENEEDVTRCICGQQEYPGIPVPVEDTLKASSKGNSVLDPIAAPASLPEDTGGLFIQCDVCKVWQHGGCVGIINQAMIPNDEYFCEECRKDLHKITSTANGQKFSRYIPVQELASLPSSPSPAPQDTLSTKPKSSRSSRANAESLSGKRRSTMNSRDAAYDEAEQIRRAIEESKKEGDAPGTSVSTRRGKRSRSESEQHEDTKRQRIGSDSSSSPSDSKTLHPNAESDEEADQSLKIAGGSHKTIRGASTRNNRDKEIRDREEKRERERADAAGRRKGRAERRRVDESEPSEEPLSRTTSTKGAENPVPRIIPTPPTTEIPLPKSSHHRKTGRPPARRGRIGRNQYTKDRDPRPSDLALPDPKSSPLRSQSHSRNADDRPNHSNYNSNCAANGSSNGGTAGHSWANNINQNHEVSRPNFKTRRLSPKCNTMNDMKRRVSNILEFISRTQIEMAGTSLPAGEESTPISRTRTRTHSSTTIVAASITAPGSDRHAPAPVPVGSTATTERFNEACNLIGSTNLGGGRLELAAGLNEEVFKSLSSMEMMEILTRGLMKWQGEYGNVDGK